MGITGSLTKTVFNTPAIFLGTTESFLRGILCTSALSLSKTIIQYKDLYFLERPAVKREFSPNQNKIRPKSLDLSLAEKLIRVKVTAPQSTCVANHDMNLRKINSVMEC